MKEIIVSLFLISGFILACSSGANLSREEKSKLDPALQKLLGDEDVSDKNYNVIIKEDGSKLYGVIIKSTDALELENAGIFLNSISGNIITAKLSVQEIRKVVVLPTVISIENSSKSYPK